MKLEDCMNYKLCYIHEDNEYLDSTKTLYFTEQDLKDAWGDDWDDIPYEHNSGIPYIYDYSQPEQGVKNGVGIYPKINILEVVMFNQCYPKFITPRTDKRNSQYSVKQINDKVVPWLTILKDDTSVHIQAGTTFKEFLDIIKPYKKDIGIYIPLNIVYNEEDDEDDE